MSGPDGTGTRIMRGARRDQPPVDSSAGAVVGKRFWINTVSLDHVEAAVAGGFTQADHGAATRLRQPHAGDEMIFYSPRTALWGGRPVRQFTARATITGDEPYQATVSDDFRPWRLAATFHPCTPTDAKPLVAKLSFITDVAHWGLPFRRGLFPIPSGDFAIIAAHMALDGTPSSPARSARESAAGEQAVAHHYHPDAR